MNFNMERGRSFFIFLILFVIFSQPLFAQKSSVAPFDLQKAEEASKIKDPVIATKAYLDSVPLERREKTKAYAHGNYFLDIVEFFFLSAILLWLVISGLSVRFRNFAQRITKKPSLQTAIYWFQFFVVITLIQFPLNIYTSYYREKKYDLLTQSFSHWLSDQAIGFFLGAFLGAVLLMALYAVLRKTPRTWWLWGSLVMILFLVVTIAIAPVFIMPLFNKFTPIKNSELRENILKMAHEHGIHANEVYEMDASKRTDRISAFVNGILGTTRIVMFDNTLKRCTPQEIQMIMGHEMGHFVLNHVWRGVAYFSVLIILGFLFVRWAFNRFVLRRPNLGIESVADPAGLPLLWLLLGIFLFITSPITNTFSRSQELQADNFGLDASHQPDAAATTFLKLGEYRELDPTPTVEFLFFDHPSGQTRILNSMKWKASHSAR
ncbi:M48 family metallopeptidase [bacterium]|nr:M48 family metallopeptidase [bacterium]